MSEPPTRRKLPVLNWLGVILLCLANLALVHFVTFRHLYPGQWRGQVGLFPIELWAFLPLFVTFTLAAYLLQGKKGVVPVIMLTLSMFTPCFLPFRPDPEFRAGIEKPSYLQAARTGTPFGDQYEEEVDGRELIYWRWATYGIDNAIGVIYDPEDRFLEGHLDNADRVNPEYTAFRKATGGHLWTSKRMGDGLYLITHS